MPPRFFLPVMVGNRQTRIFVDDIRQAHRRKKSKRPQLPKYSDEGAHDDHKDNSYWFAYTPFRGETIKIAQIDQN
jgi:hypothetical protein